MNRGDSWDPTAGVRIQTPDSGESLAITLGPFEGEINGPTNGRVSINQFTVQISQGFLLLRALLEWWVQIDFEERAKYPDELTCLDCALRDFGYEQHVRATKKSTKTLVLKPATKQSTKKRSTKQDTKKRSRIRRRSSTTRRKR